MSERNESPAPSPSPPAPDLSRRLVQHLKYGTVWHIDHPFVVVDVVKDGIWVMLAGKHEREAAVAEFKRRQHENRRESAQRRNKTNQGLSRTPKSA